MARTQLALLDRKLLGPALVETFRKLDPRVQARNPVMFVVYVGTIATALLYARAVAGHGEAPPAFILAITVWLSFTVLFANFAEALAEGRSRAQASALRDMRQTVLAKKIADPTLSDRSTSSVKAEDLRRGDLVLVEAGDIVPVVGGGVGVGGGGEEAIRGGEGGGGVEGPVWVDESAITGESAPVIRESGGD